jgi:MYXO-CTERM domain-containing protein
MIYDANRNLLGPGSFCTLTPEPSTVRLMLVAVAALAALRLRQRRAQSS